MIEAVVQTGSVETVYRRAGCGPAVLLLAARTVGEAAGLFDRLAECCRVYAPVLPDGAAGAGCPGSLELWLRGLIDGLGLTSPAVVARATLAAPLLHFAMADPGRVGRILLLEEGDDAPGAPPRVDALRDSGHPIMLVRLPGPWRAGGPPLPPELLEFLSAC